MVTISDVLDQVRAMLALDDTSPLPARWQVIAVSALAAANRDVFGILARRDLTPAQVNLWTGLDSAILTLALYWSMAQGGPMQGNVPQEKIEALDIREWLKSAVLTDAAGKIIKPDPSSGLVGHGAIKGGWDDVKAKEPIPNRIGFIDPSTGRLRGW
jgi:hypothetical protein